MKLKKYLWGISFAVISSTVALAHVKISPEFENRGYSVRHQEVRPERLIIESFYSALCAKPVIQNGAPQRLAIESQLPTLTLQAPSFDFSQPIDSKTVVKAIAAQLHAGDTAEAQLMAQNIAAVFEDCDYDKKAAKREGIQDIFKTELGLIQDGMKVKPERQVRLKEELQSIESAMNQGLEKALQYPHEKQKEELLLALDAELDTILQARKKKNAESRLISKKELSKLGDRTKGQIEESFVTYPENPPAPKRIQAMKQAEIYSQLDVELDGLKTRVRKQKDMKHPRIRIHTASFDTPTPLPAQKVERPQNQRDRRAWAIKAQAWELKTAK